MVFVMVIGYPLSLLAGTSAFQSLLGGSSSTSSQTEKIVKDARAKVIKLDCAKVASITTTTKGGKPVTVTAAVKHKRTECADQLRKLGGGYSAMATPELKSDNTYGD